MTWEMAITTKPITSRDFRPVLSISNPPGISQNILVNPKEDNTIPTKSYEMLKEAAYKGRMGSVRVKAIADANWDKLISIMGLVKSNVLLFIGSHIF